jgi:hypothetical protein
MTNPLTIHDTNRLPTITVASDDFLVVQDTSAGLLGKATINNVVAGADAVDGPASATDNAIARFDGTTGKLIQNSAATIADTTGAIACGPVTQTGAGANVFNNTSLDADFTVKKLTSGNAIAYDAGANSLALDATTITATGAVGITGAVTATGNVIISAAGSGLQVKEGSNARMGTATLSGGTIEVANTSAATGDRIFIQRVSGTAAEFGHLSYTISNGVSFTINSTDAQDDSVVNWLIIKPSA